MLRLLLVPELFQRDHHGHRHDVLCPDQAQAHPQEAYDGVAGAFLRNQAVVLDLLRGVEYIKKLALIL